MRVLFTKGMIAADFLGDRTGIRIGRVLPNGPQQEAVGLFFLAAIALKGAGRLHGSTKLAGEGRLWMMCCAPLISIIAQSLCMAVILPPETADRRRSGGPASALHDIQTGPVHPGRGRRHAQPSRRGHV